MYLLTRNKHECFGCFSCLDVCPLKSIGIEQSEDGFLYPKINYEKCIECKKCAQVCPSEADLDFKYPIDCFAAINKNNEDLKKSSSGGAFKAIVQSIYSVICGKYKRIYVCGAVFDENFKCIHKLTEYSDSSSIDMFCKSKYVQSNLVNVYNEICTLLKDKNNYIIFSGTPCQVAALKSILGNNQENLFTIDLICHGAPSQKFFDDYLDKLETDNNSKVVSFEFRNKEILDNGTYYNRSAKYILDNGTSRKVTRFSDPFLKSFYEKIYVARESCMKCSFKRAERIGDITIGDAWGIEKLYEELNPIIGVSVVIFNSEFSIKLKDGLSDLMTIYDCDYEFIVQNNAALRK